MIVPLKEHFEKNAGKTTRILQYFRKHPLQVIVPVAAVYAANKFGQSANPLHQMISERSKRGVMKNQQMALGEIINELKKNNKKPSRGPRVIKRPLV